MTAGVAKGVITNDSPLVMVNGRVSVGTREDIHPRVLVLNDGASRLGPMPIVAMQGEICAPIPTRELVRLNAYQAQVIQIQYASPVGWAREVEDEMVAHVVRMVAGILE